MAGSTGSGIETDRRTQRRRAVRTAVSGGVALFTVGLALGPAIASASSKTSKTNTAAVATTTTVKATTTTSTTVKAASSGKGSGSGDKFAEEFQQWNTTRAILPLEARYVIHSDKAGSSGATGAGVDVGLIDTGVAPVPGLDQASQVVNGPDLSLDYQTGITPGLDAYGHGTHMASLIAGSTGMAPGARIVNLKVGAADGAVDITQIIASIDWAVEHRHDPGLNIRVLSLSLGTDSVQPYQIDPLAHAVESAWHNGVVVVVAAGNSGAALSDPAIDPFVITVGALDTNDPYSNSDDVVAPFSSVGTAARRVDVVAPGVSILGLRVPGSYIDQNFPSAAVGPLFKGSGTSQATAITAGAVAQILSAHPTYTPDQVKAVLVRTAHRTSLSPDTAQGAGLIDVDAAAKASTPSNAIQIFPVSNGLGSLEAARGGAHLVADDGTILQGEVDLQGAAWNPLLWAPASALGLAWTGGIWNGSVWAGSDWAPDGTYGSVFLGRTWRTSLWTGRTWRADIWLRSTWRGRTWRAGSWA